MQTFKRILPTLLMLVFELVIGVMLLINGEKVTWISFIAFGSLLLLIGLISLIVTIISGKKLGAIPTLPMVLSIVTLAVGAFVLAASDYVLQVVSAVTMIYGGIMIISGVLKMVDGFTFRAVTGSVNGFVMFSSVLEIIFGFVIAFNPFGTAVFIWTLLGIGLIVSAVLDIITLVIYGKILRDYRPE